MPSPKPQPPDLPPGQQLVAPGRWPLVGERQSLPPAGEWTVELTGLVEHSLCWTVDELARLDQDECNVDIHCVTRWSKLGVQFAGVRFGRLLNEAAVQSAARFVSFVSHSERKHSTSLSLEDALSLDAMIALTCDGQPLPPAHGGPVRVVVPGRCFYKSLKWLTRIELLAEDRLGYWEAAAGYHNRADPRQEQRYIAASLTKQQAAQLIAGRDFSGRDLRGLDAAGRDLSGLNAADALLRDANFRRCVLRTANLHRANLSNAHLENADLRDASFIDADCEGASFTGADLRGVNFSGASLLAATFSPDARVDHQTRISREQIDSLMPAEVDYLRLALG